MKKIFVYIILSLSIYTFDMSFQDPFADPFSEDDWGDSFIIEERAESSRISDIHLTFLEERVTFTGKISYETNFISFRDSNFLGEKFKDITNSNIKTNLFLDIRLEEGSKAFASFELNKNTNKTMDKNEVKINELFIDFNLDNSIYFRFGQQNIAWGRGYFFNPTDLISVERKSIDDVDGIRTGNFGIRAHIPHGLEQNFYAYINLHEVDHLEDIGIGLKYDFLVNDTEYSISLYNKNNTDPLIGFDFSTGYRGYNIFGEARVSGSKYSKKYKDGMVVSVSDNLILKSSLGYQKSFDYKDEKNKINLVQEFYFNSIGYKEDELDIGFLNNPELFRPLDLGSFYLANFISIKDFIKKDITLTTNTVSNLSDNSHTLINSISYKLYDKISVGAGLHSFIGRSYREMTINNVGNILSFNINLNF